MHLCSQQYTVCGKIVLHNTIARQETQCFLTEWSTLPGGSPHRPLLQSVLAGSPDCASLGILEHGLDVARAARGRENFRAQAQRVAIPRDDTGIAVQERRRVAGDFDPSDPVIAMRQDVAREALAAQPVRVFVAEPTGQRTVGVDDGTLRVTDQCADDLALSPRTRQFEARRASVTRRVVTAARETRNEVVQCRSVRVLAQEQGIRALLEISLRRRRLFR